MTVAVYDEQFAAWQTATELVGNVAPGMYVEIYYHQPEPVEGPDWYDSIIDRITGRPMYYDKQGTPISMRRWGELREYDSETGVRNPYFRIGKDAVGEAKVSTVWLGMDHGFSFTDPDALPVIFETMIFGGPYDEYMRRYTTEEAALKGHQEAVLDLRAGMEPWWAYGGPSGDEWRCSTNAEPAPGRLADEGEVDAVQQSRPGGSASDD